MCPYWVGIFSVWYHDAVGDIGLGGGMESVDFGHDEAVGPVSALDGMNWIVLIV
jgi:hypothetical protein